MLFPSKGNKNAVSNFTPPPPTGTLLGAIALVAGTTVGAGILALPAKTLEAGFGPASATLIGAWVYMASSGLLIAEGGSLLLELGAGSPLAALPKELAGPPLFTAIFGGGLVLFEPKVVDKVNTVLVAGVIASFIALLGLGIQQVDPALLAHVDVPAVLPAIPITVLALVYHNVVPTICNQLGYDLPKIRLAILAGSALPTLMFIAWSAVILGSVPYDAASAAAVSGETFDPLQVLRSSGDAFGETVRIFSLLAVVTSFIGFYYGLTDFFSDFLGFDESSSSTGSAESMSDDDGGTDGMATRSPLQNAILSALTLLPPLGFALYDPSIFFSALDNAGTYGILTLFGIIPAAMAWSQRYGYDEGDAVAVAPDALPGGKVSLAAMVAAASGIIGVETWERVVTAGSL